MLPRCAASSVCTEDLMKLPHIRMLGTVLILRCLLFCTFSTLGNSHTCNFHILGINLKDVNFMNIFQVIRSF